MSTDGLYEHVATFIARNPDAFGDADNWLDTMPGVSKRTGHYVPRRPCGVVHKATDILLFPNNFWPGKAPPNTYPKVSEDKHEINFRRLEAPADRERWALRAIRVAWVLTHAEELTAAPPWLRGWAWGSSEIDLLGKGPPSRQRVSDALFEATRERWDRLVSGAIEALHGIDPERWPLPEGGVRPGNDAARAMPKASPNQTSDFTPLDCDLLILEALAKRQTRVKISALSVPGVGEGLKGERLLALEAVGWVDRAAGKRSGWAITALGREKLRASNAPVART